jgi:hypothetical protein
MAVSRLGIVKFLELVVAIVILGLLYKNGNTGNTEIDLITDGAVVGFIVILIGGFSGHMLSSPITKRIDVFYCLVGCALFIAAGALNIKHYDNQSFLASKERRDYGLAIAGLCIVDGVIFLLDSLFTWRGDY